jgi:hypothetical protein
VSVAIATDAHEFCRAHLAIVRGTIAHGAPKHLTALRSFRDNYTVEGGGGFVVEVQACCAWDARAIALEQWDRRLDEIP